MSFENGILNLTNWLGNVIMPTMAGLLFAVAIVRYAKGYPWNYSMWAAVAALCELLPIRAYLDQGLVRTNGALVSSREPRGAHSHCHRGTAQP